MTENNGVFAAHFDGATFLQNSGTVSPPPSGPYQLISYWYSSQEAGPTYEVAPDTWLPEPI